MSSDAACNHEGKIFDQNKVSIMLQNGVEIEALFMSTNLDYVLRIPQPLPQLLFELGVLKLLQPR
jgi:hypothetical protein